MKSEQSGNRWQRTIATIKANLAWLRPGLGYKRWVALIILGAMFIGLGIALLILDYYRSATNPNLVPILAFLSLRFLSRPLRFLIFGGIGLGLIILGISGANRSLLKPFERNGKPALAVLKDYRRREKGLKVVVIGGGHGLSSVLRGLKEYTHNITAVVTVADNGGSSGELRREMGVLPPGDIRNCLTALSSDEALLSQVFQYRFKAGAGLEGHSFGNLFITALSEITGSFEEAVAESGKVLAIYGQVLPSTISNIELVGTVIAPDGAGPVEVRGESQLTQSTGKIERVWLEPAGAPAYPLAISAVLNADLIIIGPGSLYTSILPNLLISGLRDAIATSPAQVFFVCNVATERGETEGYNASDHLRVIEQHVGKDLFDLVLCNRNFRGNLGSETEWVIPDEDLHRVYKVYESDLVDDLYPWRHSSRKLARVIMDLFEERTGPLG